MKLGYLLEDYQKTGIKIPLNIKLAKQTSSVLIAGKSGSGKSLSARWYIGSLLTTRESAVYIADYKGGEEYEAFEGSLSYASGSDAVTMIQDFYDFFVFVRQNKVKLETHYTLFVEEWFGLLTYAETQSKKLKAELQAKIGELLAVSRGLNMGVFICVQRADAHLFESGSREQFQCVLSFGRCSAEQFRMLGFSGELEENPTSGYKPGQALALIDGQESVQEIIVPRISNPDVLDREIRNRLDCQPGLAALISGTAEGWNRGQKVRTE